MAGRKPRKILGRVFFRHRLLNFLSFDGNQTRGRYVYWIRLNFDNRIRCQNQQDVWVHDETNLA